jgi:hypothetical protein
MVYQALNFIYQRKPTQLLTLEIQFIPHDLCDENHERQVEVRVQALLETVDNSPLKG